MSVQSLPATGVKVCVTVGLGVTVGLAVKLGLALKVGEMVGESLKVGLKL